MAIQDDKNLVLKHWNEKKIVVHKRINQDIDTAMARTLKFYPVEEVMQMIDFYSTILELDVPENKRKYFWTYKWNLYEFLMRGIKKFDGQEPSNYLKKQTVQESEALVFKRRQQ